MMKVGAARRVDLERGKKRRADPSPPYGPPNVFSFSPFAQGGKQEQVQTKPSRLLYKGGGGGFREGKSLLPGKRYRGKKKPAGSTEFFSTSPPPLHWERGSGFRIRFCCCLLILMYLYSVIKSAFPAGIHCSP